MTRPAKLPRRGPEGDPVIFRRHRRRVEMRMTTRELSDALDVSMATVWRWERGITSPSQTQALAWVNALDQYAAEMVRICQRPGGSF